MVHGARRQAGGPVFGRAATRIDRERDGARRYAGLVHGHGQLDQSRGRAGADACAARAPGAAESGAPIGPLSLDVGVWALFWRAMILGFSELAVIPLPWIARIFIRWFVERIQLPGGWRVGFVGRAEDIWWVFILYALCAVAGEAY